MKFLRLENSTSVAIVNAEDFTRLCIFKWFTNGFSIYRNDNRLPRNRVVSLTSEIMRQPKQMFDHRDRNYLNNQKENLRPCTQQQNCRNRTKMKGTSSIYKGVSFVKSRNNWKASIYINYKEIYLGSFSTQEEAALVYNKAAMIHYKEFAVLNIINQQA